MSLTPPLTPEELAYASKDLERQLAESDPELKKAAALEALGPLGFVDTNDGESPEDIYHPIIGVFDSRKVNLANIISLAFDAGAEAGKAELQAKFRKLIGVSPD